MACQLCISTIGIHIYVCTRAHILILHENTFMRVWACQHVRSNRYAMSGISILIVSIATTFKHDRIEHYLMD